MEPVNDFATRHAKNTIAFQSEA